MPCRSVLVPLVLAYAMTPRLADAATTCRLDKRADATVVAPHLGLVAQSGVGTCPLGLRVVARGPSGAVWSVDNQREVWRSTDDGTNWTLTTTFPRSGYANVLQVLPLASGAVLAELETLSGSHVVMRLGSNGDWSARDQPSLVLPAGSTLRPGHGWAQVGADIYLAEFGDTPQPVHLWRSTDDGVTFSVTSQWSPGTDQPRRLTGVYADPYKPGRLWVTAGDTGEQPRVGYSDDGGKRFTWVVSGGYATSPQARAAGLMFTDSAVLWGTASPEKRAWVMAWSRATATLRPLSMSANGPFQPATSSPLASAQFSTVSIPSSDGYLGDEFLHVITASGTGSDATVTTLPWRRSPLLPLQKMYVFSATVPDAAGRFWVSLLGAEGAPGNVLNLEFQLTAAVSAPPATNAKTCAPTNATAPRDLSTHVRLVKSQTGRGTCPLGIRIAAQGADSAVWGVDYNRNLWRSADNTQTWTPVATLPTGWRGFTQVMPLSSGTLLVEANDGNDRRHLFRATGPETSPSFDLGNPVMDLPAGSYIRANQDWAELDGDVFIGEYGSAPATVHLWRSVDDGRHFVSAATWPGGNAGIRHIHGVFADPYAPHRLWITIGDTGSQPRIGYSDDAGRTWTWIVQGNYPKTPRARAVGLMFTRSAVLWGSDSPELPAGLYRWDRATGAVTTMPPVSTGRSTWG